MKRFARLLQYMPLLLALSAGAQDPAPKPMPMPDVYGNLDIGVSKIPDSSELNIQLDWPAVDGAYYFVEHTGDLLEGFGSIKLFAGSRANPEGKLGLGLQSTAPMGFYRLFITDDENHPRLLADDDGDKISNLLEAQAGWDAYEQPADLILDTDNDGMPDYWEQFHFGNLNQDGTGDADGDGVSNKDEFNIGDNPEAEETERTVFEFEVQKELEEFLSYSPWDRWKDIFTDDVAFNHGTAATKRKQKHEGYWEDIPLSGPEIKEYNDWKVLGFYCDYTDYYSKYQQIYEGYSYNRQGHYKLHSFSGKPLILLAKHSEHEEIIEEDTLKKTTAPTGVVSYEVIHWDGESLTIDGDALELPTEERECKYEYGEVELPYRVDLEYKNDNMTKWKSTNVAPYGLTQIGVIKNDTLHFQIATKLEIEDDKFTWTANGEEIGTGVVIEHTFNALGEVEIIAFLNGKELGKTLVAVDEATGLNHAGWAFLYLEIEEIAQGYEIKEEALTWAKVNRASLGEGLGNGRADAARHAYWCGIMTLEWNADKAIGLSTAYEVTNLSGNAPHNESVMDLANNAFGVSFASGANATRETLVDSIYGALNNNLLTILTDYDNNEGSAFLKPSNL